MRPTTPSGPAAASTARRSPPSARRGGFSEPSRAGESTSPALTPARGGLTHAATARNPETEYPGHREERPAPRQVAGQAEGRLAARPGQDRLGAASYRPPPRRADRGCGCDGTGRAPGLAAEEPPGALVLGP